MTRRYVPDFPIIWLKHTFSPKRSTLEDEFYEFEINQLKKSGFTGNSAAFFSYQIMDIKNLPSKGPAEQAADFEILEYNFSEKAVLTRLGEISIIVLLVVGLGIVTYYGYVWLRKHVWQKVPTVDVDGADVEADNTRSDDSSEDAGEKSRNKIANTFRELNSAKNRDDNSFHMNSSIRVSKEMPSFRTSAGSET